MSQLTTNQQSIPSSSSTSPFIFSRSSYLRHKSTQPSYIKDDDDEGVKDVVSFPSSKAKNVHDETPVLLNSKEHAVGYLNRILNARVYEAAIETKLQHAKSLSTVRQILFLRYNF